MLKESGKRKRLFSKFVNCKTVTVLRSHKSQFVPHAVLFLFLVHSVHEGPLVSLLSFLPVFPVFPVFPTLFQVVVVHLFDKLERFSFRHRAFCLGGGAELGDLWKETREVVVKCPTGLCAWQIETARTVDLGFDRRPLRSPDQTHEAGAV